MAQWTNGGNKTQPLIERGLAVQLGLWPVASRTLYFHFVKSLRVVRTEPPKTAKPPI